MRPALAALFLIAISGAPGAQTRPPLTRADYGQFESLSPGAARGGLSADGRWLAYTINRSDRTSELRLLRIADGTVKTVAQGTQATFSDDSKWVAYSIGYSEAEQERLRRDRRPIQNKLGLMNLSTAELTTVDGIQSFTFSSNGAYLAMRRYPPQPPAGAGAPSSAPPTAAPAPPSGEPADPVGATVLVRDLATGRDTTFGNVSELAWQTDAATDLLAMTISTEGQVGNGVHLFNPATAVLRVLESANASFTALAWREKQNDLTFLKSKTNDGRDGPTYVAIAWQQLGASGERRVEFDPTIASDFPAGMRTVSFRRPAWSDDGRMVFLGVATWAEKPPAPQGGRRGGGAGASGADAPADPPSGGRGARGNPEADEPAAVDIWHWKDVDVLARQKISAAADRRRNLLAVWHLEPNRVVQIGKSFTESVTPIRQTTKAYAEDWTPYAMDRSIGRPAADLFVVDLATGARTKLKDRVDDRYAQVSPGGRYLLFLQDDHYWTMDLASRAVRNITKAAGASFVDRESDATVAQKPPFGVAGWTKDDAAVLVYDAHDIWKIATDGTAPLRLTNGAADRVRHRVVRLDPSQDAIDLQQPLHVSLFGLWSKKSGYGVIAPGASGTAAVDRLVWLDKSIGSLARAERADVVSYIVQGHDDSPDLFVAAADLRNARQMTRTNQFQEKFAWSRSELIEYAMDPPAGAKGRREPARRLQGALYYPAGYQPGKAYPMIVYVYERLSDGVHRFVPPSDRDYYNTTVFTSQGYFVLQPDIVFRPREPGLSVVECVTPAVKRVVEMGLADPARVGIIGHSWGGFDTAYLATHTKTFAAGVAGAAITNLVSNYGNHHWSSGIAETDHIETGQQRMEVPLWEDFDAYVRNSAVFNVQNMTTPLLLMTGDNDGTVYWHQSVELYNIARRARKNVVMLVYNGEDHGLRQKKNQVDYQRRILDFFGHYLKGEPAAAWVASGQSFLERDAEVKRLSGGRYP